MLNSQKIVGQKLKKLKQILQLRDQLSTEYINTFWSKSSAKIEDDVAEAAKGLI